MEMVVEFSKQAVVGRVRGGDGYGFLEGVGEYKLDQRCFQDSTYLTSS